MRKCFGKILKTLNKLKDKRTARKEIRGTATTEVTECIIPGPWYDKLLWSLLLLALYQRGKDILSVTYIKTLPPIDWLASNFTLESNIRVTRTNWGNDYLLKKLLIIRQILLVSTSGNYIQYGEYTYWCQGSKSYSRKWEDSDYCNESI